MNMIRNGVPIHIDEFEKKYRPLAAQSESVKLVVKWLRRLRQLAEDCSDIVITGIAYGKFLQHLEQERESPRQRPSVALLFETNLPSMYEAAIDISDKIIAPFFEEFGYFPYFVPITREEMKRAREEEADYYKGAFRTSSVRFFSR